MSTQLFRNDAGALATDLYQLTMAYGYWKTQTADHRAVFHLYFRQHPFDGGITVSCGQGEVLEYLSHFGFQADDIDYLATLQGGDGEPMFDRGFLQMLAKLELSVDIWMPEEGTVVFPHEPLIRIEGSLLECQLLETALLNIMGFQTLVATKAARIVQAAGDEPVLEFGMRRAQGFGGALAASRAAFVGGCSGTSNVLAGKLYGIPVRGTHAHSWIMSFDSELDAFEAYAEALPNNCIFLVDTYNTLEGIRNAIKVGNKLRAKGYEMVGVRLDSGDLAWLSIESRRLLDEAGFENAVIVASNDLDERLITSLKDQGACIGSWGVGTKLATAYDQPALGAVYKLSALKPNNEDWRYTIKLSEQRIKISNPGFLQVARFMRNGEYSGDAIYNVREAPSGDITIVDPADPNRERTYDNRFEREELLKPMMRAGRRLGDPEPLAQAQQRARVQLRRFHRSIKRFDYPHQYPVGLEKSLDRLKTKLVRSARGLD